MADIPLPQIVQRLNAMEEKWRNANSDVSNLCRDAANEITCLRERLRAYETMTLMREFYMGSG